jgi:hypothetical protein
LGLDGEGTKEWDCFHKSLNGVGIQLQERPDDLKWIGRDKSRILSVKNVYNALASKLWQKSHGGRWGYLAGNGT